MTMLRCFPVKTRFIASPFASPLYTWRATAKKAKPPPGGLPEAVEKLFEKYGSPLLRPDPMVKRMTQRKCINNTMKTPNE